MLIEYLQREFPSRKEDMPGTLKNMWYFKDNLYKVQGVPMVNNRMYIPESLWREVLDTLHLAHQGVSTMKNATRPRFFWPGMNAAIAQVKSQYATEWHHHCHVKRCHCGLFCT